MARRNSVESLKDDSSVSSGSIDGSDEDSDEDLITVLKKLTFLKAKKPLVIEPWCRKVSEESRKSGQLCSIPEDSASAQCPRFVPLDEEPICHRSPVSLDNGYRPHILQQSKDTLDQNELVSEIFDEIPIDEQQPSSTAFSIWSFLAVLSYFLRYIMILLCICTLFVIFVILTHQHSRYIQCRYIHSFCLSSDI